MSAAGLFAVETTIKGRRMDIIEKGQAVVFKGDVRLIRGGDLLTANEMRTTRARDSVTAVGNVRLFRRLSSTETVTAYGRSAFYETRTGAGHLEGNGKQARIIHSAVLSSTMTRRIEIRADRVDFFREGQRAIARGQVTGETTDPATKELYEFASPEAEYQGENRSIILRTGGGRRPAGRPVLTQTLGEERKTITGDRITYHLDDERLISEGGARAVLVQSGDPEESK